MNSAFEEFDVQPHTVCEASDGSVFAIGDPDEDSADGLLAIYAHDPEVGSIGLDLNEYEARVLLTAIEMALSE